jgi:hypothetical protein
MFLSAQEFAYSFSNDESDNVMFYMSDDENGEIEIEIEGENVFDFVAADKERMKKIMREIVFDRGSYYELIRFPDQAELKKLQEEMKKKREEMQKQLKENKNDKDEEHRVEKHFGGKKFRAKKMLEKPMLRKMMNDGGRMLIEKKYIDKSFVMTGENLKADKIKEIKDSKLKDADKKSLLEHIENKNFELEARRLSYTINIIRDHIDKGNTIK